ncbi:unnamed protein product [Vitrella brassicaformis CCMP3155]|uniref:Uncharacterized protein n=1 Tax=Vitrella brassicaformis (strain CCMP3155) TaxID=1169540 RepID=A0A0G4EXU6_VITBC|nr:unnamed protein product [Vitrella brassicaformis CCMP3155]|eukprot:CEM03225.1 unnamed protein product [Vitrella brassicaformis CCMP3155]
MVNRVTVWERRYDDLDQELRTKDDALRSEAARALIAGERQLFAELFDEYKYKLFSNVDYAQREMAHLRDEHGATERAAIFKNIYEAFGDRLANTEVDLEKDRIKADLAEEHVSLYRDMVNGLLDEGRLPADVLAELKNALAHIDELATKHTKCEREHTISVGRDGSLYVSETEPTPTPTPTTPTPPAVRRDRIQRRNTLSRRASEEIETLKARVRELEEDHHTEVGMRTKYILDTEAKKDRALADLEEAKAEMQRLPNELAQANRCSPRPLLQRGWGVVLRGFHGGLLGETKRWLAEKARYAEREVRSLRDQLKSTRQDPVAMAVYFIQFWLLLVRIPGGASGLSYFIQVWLPEAPKVRNALTRAKEAAEAQKASTDSVLKIMVDKVVKLEKDIESFSPTSPQATISDPEKRYRKSHRQSLDPSAGWWGAAPAAAAAAPAAAAAAAAAGVGGSGGKRGHDEDEEQYDPNKDLSAAKRPADDDDNEDDKIEDLERQLAKAREHESAYQRALQDKKEKIEDLERQLAEVRGKAREEPQEETFESLACFRAQVLQQLDRQHDRQQKIEDYMPEAREDVEALLLALLDKSKEDFEREIDRPAEDFTKHDQNNNSEATENNATYREKLRWQWQEKLLKEYLAKKPVWLDDDNVDINGGPDRSRTMSFSRVLARGRRESLGSGWWDDEQRPRLPPLQRGFYGGLLGETKRWLAEKARYAEREVRSLRDQLKSTRQDPDPRRRLSSGLSYCIQVWLPEAPKVEKSLTTTGPDLTSTTGDKHKLEIHDKDTKITTDRDKCHEPRADLAVRRDRIQRRNTLSRRASEEIETLKARVRELDDHHTEVGMRTKYIPDTEAKKDRALADLEVARAGMNRLQNELAQANRRADTWRRRHKDTDEQLKTRDDSLRSLTRAKEAAEAQKASTDSVLKIMVDKVVRLEKDIESFSPTSPQATIRDLTKRIAALEQELSDKQEEMHMLVAAGDEEADRTLDTIKTCEEQMGRLAAQRARAHKKTEKLRLHKAKLVEGSKALVAQRTALTHRLSGQVFAALRANVTIARAEKDLKVRTLRSWPCARKRMEAELEGTKERGQYAVDSTRRILAARAIRDKLVGQRRLELSCALHSWHRQSRARATPPHPPPQSLVETCELGCQTGGALGGVGVGVLVKLPETRDVSTATETEARETEDRAAQTDSRRDDRDQNRCVGAVGLSGLISRRNELHGRSPSSALVELAYSHSPPYALHDASVSSRFLTAAVFSAWRHHTAAHRSKQLSCRSSPERFYCGLLGETKRWLTDNARYAEKELWSLRDQLQATRLDLEVARADASPLINMAIAATSMARAMSDDLRRLLWEREMELEVFKEKYNGHVSRGRDNGPFCVDWGDHWKATHESTCQPKIANSGSRLEERMLQGICQGGTLYNSIPTFPTTKQSPTCGPASVLRLHRAPHSHLYPHLYPHPHLQTHA